MALKLLKNERTIEYKGIEITSPLPDTKAKKLIDDMIREKIFIYPLKHVDNELSINENSIRNIDGHNFVVTAIRNIVRIDKIG